MTKKTGVLAGTSLIVISLALMLISVMLIAMASRIRSHTDELRAGELTRLV